MFIFYAKRFEVCGNGNMLLELYDFIRTFKDIGGHKRTFKDIALRRCVIFASWFQIISLFAIINKRAGRYFNKKPYICSITETFGNMFPKVSVIEQIYGFLLKYRPALLLIIAKRLMIWNHDAKITHRRSAMSLNVRLCPPMSLNVRIKS